MASEGYPGPVAKGRPIRGLDAAAAIPGVEVFHAATRFDADGSVVTDGGRTLAVTAVGDSLARAKLLAYSGVREIRWPGAWCRKDISDKATAFMLAADRAAVAVGGAEPPPSTDGASP